MWKNCLNILCLGLHAIIDKTMRCMNVLHMSSELSIVPVCGSAFVCYFCERMLVCVLVCSDTSCCIHWCFNSSFIFLVALFGLCLYLWLWHYVFFQWGLFQHIVGLLGIVFRATVLIYFLTWVIAIMTVLFVLLQSSICPKKWIDIFCMFLCSNKI